MLSKLQNEVLSCTKCDLCQTRNSSVPGKGNPKSDVIFIGEAPGRSEDKVGEPFVGSAGKKLSLALENAGISREDIYITNVVKCRPPNNRVPTEDERNACKEYLDAEMKFIKPKIICIMGNTAYQSLLGGESITKSRGKIYSKNERLYFVTIHPAATIYNQSLLPILKNDIKKLKEIIENIKNGEKVKVDVEYTP